jgi:hypothetical protein
MAKAAGDENIFTAFSLRPMRHGLRGGHFEEASESSFAISKQSANKMLILYSNKIAKCYSKS